MMTALGSQAQAITSCITPVGAVKCVVGAVGGEVAKQGFEEVVAAFADGAQTMLKAVATFWTKVPDPQLDPSTSAGGQIASLAANQTYLVAVLATLGFVLGVGRLVWHNRVAQSAKELLRGLAVMTVAASLVVSVFTILLNAGNSYSDWILQRATGANSAGDAFTAIIKKSIGSTVTGVDSGLGAWFLLFLLLILGGLMQVLFMVVRGGVLYVLAVFLPLLAADSFSEEGWGRFKRALMLMLAFTIYKPVAATIYATGFKVLQSPGDPDKASANLMNGIFGLTILVLAALALPSLIKFLVPMAAMGSSGAFSGAAAVGAVATGAAMVAGGAAMGAGGAASGASSAAGGGGGAGAVPSPSGDGAMPSPSGGEGGDPKGGGASSPGGGDSSGGGSAGGEGGGSSEPSAAAPGAGGSDSAGSDDMPSGGTDGGSGPEGRVPSGGGASSPGGGAGGSSSPGGGPSGGASSAPGAGGGRSPSGSPAGGAPSGGTPGGAPAGPASPAGGGSGSKAQAGAQLAAQVSQMAEGAVPDGADEVSE